MKFIHEYFELEDNQPSSHSPEQNAMVSAFVAFYEAGGSKWGSILIERLPCDMREAHQDEWCDHYRCTVEEMATTVG